jgi:hypothetical protein
MVRLIFALIALASFSSVEARVSIVLTNYHGWPEACLLHNNKAEVVVVPAIGRVMQFGFRGEEGVFWENRSLDGKTVQADAESWKKTDWVNLGGDKAWPSPEADWGKLTGRKSWRPPPAFDGLPWKARVESDAVVLTSAVDPFLGVRVERRIKLHATRPVLTIRTTFERIAGEPARMGIWVVTQLKDPQRLFGVSPARSIFDTCYTLLGKDTPRSLTANEGLISLSRDAKSAYKIGLDADSLLWVGDKQMLRIDSPRVKRAEYPDKGSSTEIYTNPDPLPYIELETLGPLRLLKPGDKSERSNIYTLLRRSKPTPEQEARSVLATRGQPQ